jgi:hypothetical protein
MILYILNQKNKQEAKKMENNKGNIDYKLLTAMTTIGIVLTALAVYAANTGTFTVGATISNVMISPAVVANTAPTEATTTALAYSFYIEDPQGISNINNGSAYSNVSLNGLEYGATCTADVGINATTQNYSCSVNMNYYDNATTWRVFVEGGNFNLTNASNQASTFSYSSGNFINVSKADGTVTLNNWASTWYPLALDILSSDDPLIISQRGNTYSTNMGVTAYGLTATGTTDYIPAENFTINVADACGGTAMVNVTETQVASAYLPNSVAGTTENVYVCMEDVPVVTSATYASPENWVITVN